jgi:hypothetical protein
MSLTQKFAYIFSTTLGLSILLYLLRGFQIVKFLPGWTLLVAIALAVSSGFIYSILTTQR